MKPLIKSTGTLLFIVLLCVSFLPLWDLTRPGIFIAHDSTDHVARIANFFLSLSEGNIVPHWAANLNWGYGHPILIFLYPLPSYLASLFHVGGFSFEDSTKLVFAVGYVASLGTMFLWLRKQWNDRVAWVGSVLYGFAPYRFVDLYVRGAIGEHIAFVFPPLLFYSLYTLAVDKKRSGWSTALLALSTAGLLLSHNAVSLMVLPIVAVYIVYLFVFEAKRRVHFLLRSIGGIGLGFGLSAFFWIPAFFEGKYTLRDIVTKGDFRDRFVPWSWFFYSPWNFGGTAQFSKELGIIHWVGIVFGIWLWFKTKVRKEKWFIGGSLLLLFISLICMTSITSGIWQQVSLLQKFQFPWRFLTVTTLLSAVVGSISIVTFVHNRFFLLLCTLVIIGITFPMWHAKDYIQRLPTYYSDVYNGTTDTGESSPIWSVRFMENRPAAPLEVIEGEAAIAVQRRTTTSHQYMVVANTATRLVENTLYFPGWTISADGQPQPVEFQDPNHRGLMTFWLAPGSHTVAVVFGDTKLRVVANIVSFISIGFLGVWILVFRKVTT